MLGMKIYPEVVSSCNDCPGVEFHTGPEFGEGASPRCARTGRDLRLKNGRVYPDLHVPKWCPLPDLTLEQLTGKVGSKDDRMA